ncbi:HPr family phosphocarrier protein [Thalassotalea aquiviva]|uniref:HPr family phosphocarrier protein n=1 Tax=Thalassotalea aquiviva TaxID=3242415 RepID=UPI00352A8776
MTSFSRTVLIENKLGLHARAATKLAKLSMSFDAKVTLDLEGKSAEAESIMALMLLTGSKGKHVTIHSEGVDAKQALDAICELFSNKFDEGE